MISEKIKALRNARNWTTRQLAKKAGISHGMITNYEKGKAQPRERVLSKIADAFELPISEFSEGSTFSVGIPLDAKDFENKLKKALTLDSNSKAIIGAIIDKCLETQSIKNSIIQWAQNQK
jgi:transcriptional regulator with XRE-family HTH domain